MILIMMRTKSPVMMMVMIKAIAVLELHRISIVNVNKRAE